MVAIYSESCQTLVPSFSTLPSELAVLINWEFEQISFSWKGSLHRSAASIFAQESIKNILICFYALFDSKTNK